MAEIPTSTYIAMRDPHMDVCLVAMPYAAIERPSIALGLLTAELRAAGIEVEPRYAYLDFAAQAGIHAYDAVLGSRTSLFVGEWTFAAAAFPEMSAIDADYLDECAEEISASRAAERGIDPRELLLRLREEAARFVAVVADEIVARRPRIVGCTSTFQQHAASLALLRAVRERDPSIVTVIGGTNCESNMGLAARRAFPWIDFVVSGEADELIVPFVRDVLATGRNVAPPPGVIDGAIASRTGVDPPRASVWSTDAIPTPDYDDYFTALDRSPLREAVVPGLVVETSRGCWWGAKSHCTFCGLNGGNMAFRAKSPERAAEEFHRLAARYGVRRFTVVDNIIDMHYHQTMLPLLQGRGYDIFYETKANLRRHHMQSFSDAGVRSIQPGIESLHDDILRLLAKGNKAWMNVQLLKWAAELSMDISWIFLVDVPGQRDAWYVEMLGWLPLITHLPPPSYALPIQFMRFSPYHRQAAAYGLDLVPEPAYAQVYPLAEEEMRELAYEFVDRRARPDEGVGQALLLAWLGLWREEHRSGTPSVLEMRRDGDGVDIADTRSCRVADRHGLDGDAARLYLACDEAVDRGALRERMRMARFDDIVDGLLANKLLLELSGRLLALAVDPRPRPAEEPNPAGRIEWELVP